MRIERARRLLHVEDVLAKTADVLAHIRAEVGNQRGSNAVAVPRHVHHYHSMAELEAALISERVIASMKAAGGRGRRLGRPPVARPIVSEIETLAASTTLSIREIQKKIVGKASRGVVGEISKRVRAVPSAAL